MLSRLSLALLTVCSLSQIVSSCHNDPPMSSTQAITNRSTKKEPFKILMVKLKNPPLMSSSKQENKKIIIDEHQKKLLLQEQSEAEKYFKSISGDIKILHRYRFLVNGFSILIPSNHVDKLKSYQGIVEVHNSQSFSRPDVQGESAGPKVGTETSVKFIGAEKVQKELNIDGKGIRVGVIDTGIDYTHKMFGGAGTEAAYDEVKSDFKASDFPTAKVVGGIDLVGSQYDDASPNFKKRIPIPDANPLDESGHGTHVAGTIAGIGDGENTYTGVAPGALLYAIKVFGDDGSTSDAVVIAGLEYAVNPSGNLDPNDHLDVVNLSLGSPFGVPYRMYDEAIRNLIKAGVTPVTSAGNSGNVPYIVGAPSSSDDTLSVAASVDNMDQNWRFRAVLFKSENVETLSKAVEAAFGKPLDKVGDLNGKLVYIGLADKDLTAEQKAALNGNVAFIDRGAVPFAEKMTRAVTGGAIGVVVANNIDGEGLSMGGSGKFDIPAIMISKDLGTKFKEKLAAKKDVTIVFNTPQRIEEPKLIDTLTSFSSRGPRSIDSGIKPEISAPGSNIISAQSGGGAKGVSMSGTSMAAPHMSGCIALIKQAYPELDNSKIKSLVMSTSVNIKDAKGEIYPISRQGAGRVDIYKALTVKKITSSPAAIAFGEIELVQKKSIRKTLILENNTTEAMTVSFASTLPAEIRVDLPGMLLLSPNTSVEVPYIVYFDVSESIKDFQEISGYINVMSDKDEVLVKIPTLSAVRRLSMLEAESLKVHSTCKEDAECSPAELTLRNKGPNASEALIFNLLGENPRKDPVGPEKRLTDICDLESVAYRTVEKEVSKGVKEKVLQFAAKLHSPLTSWEHCELSIQIDGNGDEIVDQELIGGSVASVTKALPLSPDIYKTILTDANMMRSIRKDADNGGKADFFDAIVAISDLKTYDHGTLMVLTVPLSKLKVRPFGLLKVKIASLASAEPFSTPDDFLGTNSKTWWTIDPFERASAYYGMPETVKVDALSSVTVPLTRGEGLGELIVYYPFNKSTRTAAKDLQSELVKEEFLYQ